MINGTCVLMLRGGDLFHLRQFWQTLVHISDKEWII